MENLDKFDPELLDDEEYEPLADGDRMAAELAMQERDRKEGRVQERCRELYRRKLGVGQAAGIPLVARHPLHAQGQA